MVKAFADSANDLVDSLPYLPTYPLPGTYLDQAVRGDFLNAFVTIDLTLRRLGETVLHDVAIRPEHEAPQRGRQPSRLPHRRGGQPLGTGRRPVHRSRRRNGAPG